MQFYGVQELLREKQHHLERLMRERELERAEVAKVSVQADRAETALAQLQKEAAQVYLQLFSFNNQISPDIAPDLELWRS